MYWLTWWMRIVGAFYLILFVGNVFLQVAPEIWVTEAVRAETPAESTRILVDTWVLFGLYQGVIGAALLFYARRPAEAMPVFWMVLGFEFFGGIVHDIYMIFRGYEGGMLVGLIVWLVIHAIIIGTGFLALNRASQPVVEPASAPARA